MKKIIGIIIFNLLLISYVLITVVLTPDVKKSRLVNLEGFKLNEGLQALDNYEVLVLYTESAKPYDTILRTEPQANSFIDSKTVVRLYVSLGNVSEAYPHYLNLCYDEIKDELMALKEKYALRVEINYICDELKPDGLIVDYQIPSKYINNNDLISLTVIRNIYNVKVPSFVGISTEEALLLARKIGLQLEFINKSSLMPKGCIIGQSVKANEEVKKKTLIVLYVAE